MKEYLVSIKVNKFGEKVVREQSLEQQEINVYADSDNVYEALSKGHNELLKILLGNKSEQSISFKLPIEKELKLKYHDVSQDKLVTDICMDRERLWTKLIGIFRANNRSWDIDEIEAAILSLQEYFSLDYPKEQFLSIQQYCRIIDNLLRISISYNSLIKNGKTIDNGGLLFITKKIMEIFLALGISE